MKNLIHTLRFIWDHPLNREHQFSAIKKFLLWQLAIRVFGGQKTIAWVDDSKFRIGQGDTGLTGNLYTGFMEWRDMLFVLHALTPEMTFVDVGANLGAYSILASKVVGAKSIAFEPLPDTAKRLREQLHLNQIEDLVTVMNCGVGSQNGVLAFTNSEDTRNRVSSSRDGSEVTQVPVVTLDSAIDHAGPMILKVDVEGYEYEVLKGADVLLSSGAVQAILIEVNCEGGYYGSSKEQIHELITSHGFIPVTYDPLKRKINKLSGFNPNNENTIYLANLGDVEQRCIKAPVHYIHTANGSKI